MTALLDRTVLSRLNRLSSQVEAIRQNPNVVGRVAVPGSDEIGRLAQQFNRLLESSEHHMEALERSNQDLEGFARVVSHDLQPHLSTILLNAAILRQAAGLEASQAARLDRIEATAKRMAQLMRGILDYSAAASTRGAWQDVDLQALMEEVVSTLEDTIAKGNARVEWRGLPVVSGNAVQIQQLLQNLIANAIKYHRPGVPPVVTVTAHPALDLPGGHRIEVQDNGLGFEPARFHDLVQPYFRIKEGSDGHGLGLATCMKIAQRHGGSLTADSVPGQGSTFAIELPPAGQHVLPAPGPTATHAPLAAAPVPRTT
jgi:signal transduction histidine kinase